MLKHDDRAVRIMTLYFTVQALDFLPSTAIIIQRSSPNHFHINKLLIFRLHLRYYPSL